MNGTEGGTGIPQTGSLGEGSIMKNGGTEANNWVEASRVLGRVGF